MGGRTCISLRPNITTQRRLAQRAFIATLNNIRRYTPAILRPSADVIASLCAAKTVPRIGPPALICTATQLFPLIMPYAESTFLLTPYVRLLLGPEKAATGHAVNVVTDSDASTASATVHSTRATCS